MSKKEIIVTYEFGTLVEGKSLNPNECGVPEKAFNNLWNFILSSDTTKDSDVIMSVHSRRGRRYIKTGRYVGTIQTKDGTTIEILPKIYKAGGKQEEDKTKCREVFLNMLRHFTDTSARSFQNASLSTKKGFPILEVYISNYISAGEELILGGLKRNYANVSENQRFLKGKLDIGKQITRNATNKAVFAIRYHKYIEDIPQNRIVVSTLLKLMDETSSVGNKSRLSKLLNVLSDIPRSSNVERDLNLALGSNRLFSSYERLLSWSSQFLLNRGFTNFSGTYVNQSLLFQAEKLFEDFIGYLFKKYASEYNKTLNTSLQNARYYLVDRHDGSGMFRLKPDIVVETDKSSLHYDCVIIDTKWKAIDSQSPRSNYLIDMKDMYQLYAYGQKYMQGESVRVGHEVLPKLVLLYPYSEKFTECLPEFVYEDILEKYGLKLMVVPFDLSDSSSYRNQVFNIIRSLQVGRNMQPVLLQYDFESGGLPLVAAEDVIEYNASPKSDTMLVGCFKDDHHKDWVLENRLYNIRLGRRNGSLDSSGLMISASRLLLYDKNHPERYKVYNLDTTKQILANNEMMKDRKYPGLKPKRSYVLYVMGGEIEDHPEYDVKLLREQFAPDSKNNSPFFVEL